MPLNTDFSVCCILPTFNAGEGFLACLKGLSKQAFDYDLIIVDSSSDDETFSLAHQFADVVVTINGSDFDHGGTRQMMVERFPGYDIYLFLTQDSVLESDQSIENLLVSFRDPSVGCAYGRQIPHIDATPLAQHARLFNYPQEGSIRSLEDASHLGIKTAFCSNSFAAYRATALKEVGGFPGNVILSEDMYVAARMLLKGWKIAYVAEARCFHSHNYTLREEFSRYFDIGVFHARESWIRQQLGMAESEGLQYVLSELKYLGLYRAYLWPSSLLRNFVKLLGYRLGIMESLIPRGFKRSNSMHKEFW